MDCAEFLHQTDADDVEPLYVLAGDEDFLKRQVMHVLKGRVLGDDPDGAGLSVYQGEKAVWADVHDELDTLPFLSPRRLVIVEQADPFVTKYRPQLEKALAAPGWKAVLVIDVKTWTATTKLAKLIDKRRTITCKSFPEAKLADWCVGWAATRYEKKLASTAARLLVDLVGVELGLLDQELAKLASYVGDAVRIDSGDVDQLVGRSREANVFRIFTAIGNARPAEPLGLLDQLFEQGEEPLRILGAFSYQMRKLVQATRLTQQGLPIGAALSQAGFAPFAHREAEQQLRHLGRRRINRLYEWLLEADAGLKGSSLLPARTMLERLVVRLARKNETTPRRPTA